MQTRNKSSVPIIRVHRSESENLLQNKKSENVIGFVQNAVSVIITKQDNIAYEEFLPFPCSKKYHDK
jgi:hypothetical protein